MVCRLILEKCCVFHLQEPVHDGVSVRDIFVQHFM